MRWPIEYVHSLPVRGTEIKTRIWCVCFKESFFKHEFPVDQRFLFLFLKGNKNLSGKEKAILTCIWFTIK